MIETQKQNEPHDDHFQFECPECRNDQIFEARSYHQQLIWVCGQCGNQTKLLAKKVKFTGQAKYLN